MSRPYRHRFPAAAAAAACILVSLACCQAASPPCTQVICLDGQWQLATDPSDVGRKENWATKPAPGAKPAKVPWIIQDTFPGYHGLAWYWRTLVAPASPHARGRYLLRFWAVDYAADVWLNGVLLGRHEGGETPFILDATEAVRPGQSNLLAVRVLNPTHQPIDGIVLNQTAHRNKVMPYGSGSAWNQGGIIDSVELLLCPPVRVEDVFARGDWKSGEIRVQVALHSTLDKPTPAQVELSVAPASSGQTLAVRRLGRELAPGQSVVECTLAVPQHRLWELNDPYLYRVSARVWTDGGQGVHEQSVRCGFRDFRFDKGYFRLNGRRIYLRCSHTGNCCPVGLELPYDPDWLRRDLLNVKAMRFNAIRFISGVAKRYQLDLCDELGLMVYEEPYAAWCMADSPKLAERYDESTLGMVRRDRNHPSLVIWGLLNETSDGPVFRHAASLLPALRQLDDSRMVLLNSGRWDHAEGGQSGIDVWRNHARSDPCVTRNVTNHVIEALGIRWAPGQLALHPGMNGEYGVVRWTAPQAGQATVAATFASIAERATTDVHVLHNGKAVFDSFINVRGCGATAAHSAGLAVQTGDTLDFAVGYGNGNYGADTTALALTIKQGAKTYDAAVEFSNKANPNGPWRYGQFAPAPAPEAKTFALFPTGQSPPPVGTFCNPGNPGVDAWEDTLDDQHPYQRVPHTAEIIRTLRTISGRRDRPLFLSEYGVGSGLDLVRLVRLYEQIGKADADDGRFYTQQRDRFLADWKRWRLDECFDRPEDFLQQALAKMASQRLLGINAIRANVNVVGYSLTGTVDQGMTGEGLTTTFRELKPGTVDALFEALAPLRFCAFVEPLNVYRGTSVRAEVVLANEDALRPGSYPVRVQVVGPGQTRVLDERVTVTIPPDATSSSRPAFSRGTGILALRAVPPVEKQQGQDAPGTHGRDAHATTDARATEELPLVLPVFAKDVKIDGPAGTYRLLVNFEKGAAATGGQAEFFVAEPDAGPAIEGEVVLWGDGPVLAKWLADRKVRTRPLAADKPAAGEVILAGAAPPQPAAGAFDALRRRIEQGATAIFLCPEVFRKDNQPLGYLPLEPRGVLAGMRSWVYLKDEWAKRHPIFDGLPCGGLMDLAFYRELIPDVAFAGQAPPAQAVAGGINTSQGYSSGLLVAVYEVGKGRIVLNTLRVRENLGRHPAADRLVRNMLRFAAGNDGRRGAETQRKEER